MADTYYESNNVLVFPSVYRTYNPSGKFTNETNFANILKSIVDKDSYVISYENGTLKLVIFGYFFSIVCSNPLSSGGPVWAAIKVEQDTLGNGYNLVAYNNSSTTLDSGDRFRGIITGDSGDPPTGQASDGVFYHSLLLKIPGPNGSNVLNTKKISSNSIYFDTDDRASLTDKVNSKQDKLTAGQGIKFYTESNTLKVGIDNTRYNRLEGLTNMSDITENRAAKLNYFNNSGILTSSTIDRGHALVTVDGRTSTQSVYVNNGFITNGVSIFYSTGEPTGGGNPGDIWIRYTNN